MTGGAVPESDVRLMRHAIALARRGLGRTSPNPAVGCVIALDDGTVVAEGWHQRAGGPHAEVEALARAGALARGATAYVTLEPCNHRGRTGPCTEALLDAGVERVVVGARDPNPHVQGGGLERLRAAGLDVVAGVEEPACRELIAPFATWVLLGRPRITLKVASTLDGRIATAIGHSRWLTGPAAREDAHRLRDVSDAILVGAGTLRADDPALTTRLPEGGGKDPARVILCSDLGRLPLDARALAASGGAPPLVVAATGSERAALLRDRGVEVIVLGGTGNLVPLPELATELGRRGTTSLLVEGGAAVASAFLRARLVDHLCVYVAPKVIGDGGLGWAGPLGIRTMDQVLRLDGTRIRPVGEDVCIEGDCVYGDR